MVTATATSTTIISVQWDRVDCMQRNSDITGYVVSYGQRGNESDSETVTVMGTTPVLHIYTYADPINTLILAET